MSVRRSTCLCAGLLGAVAVGYHAARLGGVGATPPTPLAMPLDQLPRELDGWAGRDIELSESVLRVAAADAYLRRDYKRPNGEAIALYIAFYGSVKDRIPHGPTVCYPYQGWTEELNEMVTLPSEARGFPELRVRRLLYSKAGARMAVLYWYVANGRQQADTTWQKFTAALRDLIGGGGAYVLQLMVSAPATGREGDPFARLQEFTQLAFPAVARHLPDASVVAPLAAGRAKPQD
ncbi:MAG TPA: EpsI family protein [Planctomycetota bacterium]|nr:EpsI family protein [Planctomycetota bacterium]HRR81792.1 EpsI family protein [Planctomycetota bacterium]HRT94065.1 EpsI family protein [Planctomycetota bacterium]